MGVTNMIELIKCNSCGKLFAPGINQHGLPNGAGYILDNGSFCNVCTECIEKVGNMLLEMVGEE